MSIWRTTPVEQTPEIELARWTVYEVSSKLWPEKTRHFVGWNLTEREGRVSSAITEFDEKTMRGKTKSGRVYQLVGQSGHDSDAAYTWSRWCRINEIDEVEEIKVDGSESN